MRSVTFLVCSRRCIVLPLLLVLASGCGSGKTGTVSGKVLLDGKPVPGGYINFFPSGENSTAKTSPIGEDGSYSVKGVPVGTAKITVQGVAGSVQIPNSNLPKGMEMPVSDRKAVFVPPKYSTTEQSGLSYEVKSGSQDHNVELK